MQLLRERRGGRNACEQEEAAELLRRGQDELAVPAQDVAGGLEVPEHRPGDHVADGVQPRGERGDDSKVAAAAADRPEQVGLGALVGVDDASVCQHDLRAEDVVDREPGPACQVADAAAEHQPARAGGRDDAGGRGKAVRVGRPVDVAEQRPAPDRDGARLWIDVDAVERRQVDHEPAVDAREAGAVVAAAADRELEAALAPEAHCCDDVVDVRDACDQRGPLVDHGVVELARLVVAGVVRPDEGASQSCGEAVRVDLGLGHVPVPFLVREHGTQARRRFFPPVVRWGPWSGSTQSSSAPARPGRPRR
jgi:hypothetical protein